MATVQAIWNFEMPVARYFDIDDTRNLQEVADYIAAHSKIKRNTEGHYPDQIYIWESFSGLPKCTRYGVLGDMYIVSTPMENAVDIVEHFSPFLVDSVDPKEFVERIGDLPVGVLWGLVGCGTGL